MFFKQMYKKSYPKEYEEFRKLEKLRMSFEEDLRMLMV